MPLGDQASIPRAGQRSMLAALGDMMRPRQRLLPVARLGANARTAQAAVRAMAQAVPMASGTLLCRTLGRHKMLVDQGDFTHAPHLAMDGFWEWWTTRFLIANLRPGEVMVDAGVAAARRTVRRRRTTTAVLSAAAAVLAVTGGVAVLDRRPTPPPAISASPPPTSAPAVTDPAGLAKIAQGKLTGENPAVDVALPVQAGYREEHGNFLGDLTLQAACAGPGRFELTVDGQTIEDRTVTLRDRDTLEQVRIPIDELADELTGRLSAPWRSPKLAGS